VSEQVVESTQTIVNQTGEILCRVLIPAKYKTITKQVIVSPARTVERQIPAVTKQITKRVVDNSATTREIAIPAVTDTITRRVVKSAARVMTRGEAQRTGLRGQSLAGYSGFVDANSDGRDDRDGLSRTAAANADRAGGGTRGGASGNAGSGRFGQQIGTIAKRVIDEEARVVERRIPAVTKTVQKPLHKSVLSQLLLSK